MFRVHHVTAGFSVTRRAQGHACGTIGKHQSASRLLIQSRRLNLRRATAPARWVTALVTPAGAGGGGGGGSSYGDRLSMDSSSRDETGGKNDYWRGNAGGSGGTRGRGGGRGDGSTGGTAGRGRDASSTLGEGRTYGSSRTGNSSRGGNDDDGRNQWSEGSDSSRGRDRGRDGPDRGYSSDTSSDRRGGGWRGRGTAGNGQYRGSTSNNSGKFQNANYNNDDVAANTPAANERKHTARQHTGVLSKCESLDEVLEYVEGNVHLFSAVNFSTAIHKLGKLNRSARGRRTSLAAILIDDPRFQHLERCLDTSLSLFASDNVNDHPHENEFHGVWGTREICCVLWGFANVGRTAEAFAGHATDHAPAVFPTLLKRLSTFQGNDFNSQNLSNAIWALAKLHSGANLSAAQASLSAGNGKGGASRAETNYRCVRAATGALQLAITKRLTTPPRDDAFIPQGVSNSIWALAVLSKHTQSVDFHSGVSDDDDDDGKSFESGLAQETADAFSEYILAPGHANGFKSMELSNIVWAISTGKAVMKPGVSDVLNALVVRACRESPKMFSTQSVANILWAAGNTPELVPLDVNVLDALAKMTYSKFGEFTTQGLANTLWGFAGSGYNPGEGLFAEIRRAWIVKGDQYSIIELNNMLWAMHTLKENPGRGVFQSVHRRIAQLCDDDQRGRGSNELTFNHVANFMYHMAQYEELPEPGTMVRLEETLLRKIMSKGGGDARGQSRVPGQSNGNAGQNQTGRSAGYQSVESLRRFGDRGGVGSADGNGNGNSGSNDSPNEPEIGSGLEIGADVLGVAANAITPHLVANTLWAFSALKYKPCVVLQAAFDGLVGERCGDYTDQSLSMTVFAYANLATQPSPYTLQRMVSECELRVNTNGFTAQGLANSFWGWAVLAHNPSSTLFHAYARRFAEMANDEGLSRVDLVQIYQASLAFETADGENRRDDISGDGDDADGPTAGDRPPRAQHPERTKDERKRQLLKGALLARAQEVWEQTSTGRVTISTLHREVSETLTLMGVPHDIEALADDNFSLDIALRGRKVAIEVDGPSHFFANKPSEYMGADLLRGKILAVHGWKVLHLPWHEWRKEFSTNERCEYMAGLLFTGAGLTVAAASAVPGGVKMAGRRQGDTGSPFEIRGDEKFDSGGSASAEKSGMAAYVQKAVQSPHRSVRINRSGSVIVEDATTTDAETVLMRNNENVPRLLSKPDAKAGYGDGGYDLEKRLERNRETKKRLDGEELLGMYGEELAGAYGINLTPTERLNDSRVNQQGGRRSAWRVDTAAERQMGTRPETNTSGDGFPGDGVSGDMLAGGNNTSGAGESNAGKPPVRARRVAVSIPSEQSASPGFEKTQNDAPPSRGVAVRRRRVRISVPTTPKFAGSSVKRDSLKNDSGKDKEYSDSVKKVSSSPASSLAVESSTDSGNGSERRGVGTGSERSDSSKSVWSEIASSNGENSPINELRGVGAKSVARLEKFGVATVGELAKLSDETCADFLRDEKTNVKGLRAKARLALGEV